MEKISSLLFLIVVIAIIAGAFYWFEYRPDQIRKMCAKESNSTLLFSNADYQNCLRTNGLDK